MVPHQIIPSADEYHIPALHVPSSRQELNGNSGLNARSDVDRHTISAMSPRLAPPVIGLHPSKLNATPVTMNYYVYISVVDASSSLLPSGELSTHVLMILLVAR